MLSQKELDFILSKIDLDGFKQTIREKNRHSDPLYRLNSYDLIDEQNAIYERSVL